MFVLLRAYELTSPEMTIQERIALTMERGGVSIMFTSITDLVAFLIGSSSALSVLIFVPLFSPINILGNTVHINMFSVL